MNIDEHINQFNDWSFSTGRPKFADEFGTEEHTRFCLEFIKRQLSGGGGLTAHLQYFLTILQTYLICMDMKILDF